MINRRIFSLAAGAAALGGAGIVRAQSEAPIILGQSAPFSGPAAQLGIQFYQGAKLYLDQYNAVPGHRDVEIGGRGGHLAGAQGPTHGVDTQATAGIRPHAAGAEQLCQFDRGLRVGRAASVAEEPSR